MSNPDVPKKAPYVINEEPGKKYWCSCGKAEEQPYCDGSHVGTEFLPVLVELEEKKKVAWCGCKHTANKPYCDGAHTKVK